MSNETPDPETEPQQPDEEQQWGKTKLINGMSCRQCVRCGKWFNIGWLAHHVCPIRKQRRLFDLFG